MRVLPLLVVLCLSLAVAGCAKKDTPPPDTNSSTTSTTTGSTTTTTTTTTPTPGPVQPKEVKSGNADFSQNTPAAPLAAVAITIDPGYTAVTLNVTFSCLSGVPACLAANSVAVKAVGLTCALPDGPVQGSVPCTKPGSASAGAGKVEFSGNGLVSAKWSVIES